MANNRHNNWTENKLTVSQCPQKKTFRKPGGLSLQQVWFLRTIIKRKEGWLKTFAQCCENHAAEVQDGEKEMMRCDRTSASATILKRKNSRNVLPVCGC